MERGCGADDVKFAYERLRVCDNVLEVGCLEYR